MTPLPTGIVTFLFTDIEGSTRLLEGRPAAYRHAHARHDEIIRRAIADHAGVVFQSRGDGFCAAFSDPLEAVQAALESQRGLAAEDWGTVGQITSRMGLHTGAVELHGDEYFGAPLHRCARLMDSAHGGQIVLSSVTAALVGEAPPSGSWLKDLGEHRLRDLVRTERIFQLVGKGAPVDFKPLRTLTAIPNNLPMQATAFIGREQQLHAVQASLLRPDTRLVTLTGPGGTGKTRLALQAAASLLESFPDGVHFVPLAPVTAPELVLSAIAQSLDVREAAGRPMAAALADALREQQSLLVLDNFEQVVSAGPSIAALLNATPAVKVLVTSRSVLRIYGEREIAVPPLALPDHRAAPTAAHLAQFEAVHLFADRAQAARSDFALSDENAPAVAEICQRLDGLPLAIELAAARVRALPPGAMLQRMERRLPLLTGGARDLPARQRTLRDAIAWSYDLLEPDEQALFRRIAVLSGSTLESAAAVCIGEPARPGAASLALAPIQIDILDGIESLVEKSLLHQGQSFDGQPRFRMLETIREYALERLDESGESDAIRRRHVLWALSFIEAAEPEFYRPKQAAWFARVEEEHDNLRAALAWSQASGFAQPALRLVAALWWFWSSHSHVAEGRDSLESVLRRFPPKPGASAARMALHARALFGVGVLASMQDDHAVARRWQEEGLALRRAIGDPEGIFNALEGLGTVTCRQGDYVAARACLEEALDVARSLGDRLAYAMALHALGNISVELSEFDAARTYYEESRALVPTEGDHQGPMLSLASLALDQGRHEEAEIIALDALSRYRQTGNRQVEALVLVTLGGISLARGDLAEARTRLVDGLSIMQELGSGIGIAQTLERFVSLAVVQENFAGAVQIAGSVTVLHERAGAPLPTSARERLERMLSPARAALAAETVAAALQAGRSLDLDQAVAAALTITALATEPPSAPDRAVTNPPGPSVLSRRELEVATHIARGLTNGEIARTLVITEGTVANHVNHILTKLDFTSRAQVAVWVTEHGLGPSGAHNTTPPG